jgi:hypothetical protein
MRFEPRTLTMQIVKGALLLMGLSMIAALVGCGNSGSSTHTTPPPPPTITVSLSSTPTTLYVNDSVAVTATVTGDSSNAGVSWACAPSGSCGSFSASSSASGTAVTYTAPSTVPSGKVTLTATSKASSSSSKSSSGITIQSFGLAAGNYVFSVRGTDVNTGGNPNSVYFYAGVFSTDGTNITGGEQDYVDYTYDKAKEAITGGTITSNTDGTLTITLISSVDTKIGNGTGTITLTASMVSATRALLTEYDSWASGTGELDLQPAAPTGPSGGYAFYTTGLSQHGPGLSIGGVINVDGAGTISGSNSVLDINDACATGTGASCAAGVYPNQVVTASTVSTPDAFGFVEFDINSSCPICSGAFTASIVLDGYMIDSGHIVLVENFNLDDVSGSPTGGMAIAQTTAGGFTSSALAGQTYAFSASGSDSNGALQAAGLLTFNSGGLMAGNVSFNDIAAQTAQGGTAVSAGTYTVDSTGRVTVTGLSDATPTFTYSLQLYLTGEGHAFVISMDSMATAPDVLGGTSAQQAASLSASSLSGSYAMNLDQFVVTTAPAEAEIDSIGAIYADGSSNISGFLSTNETLGGGGLVSDSQFVNTFAAGSGNGVIKVNGKAQGVTVPYTAYLIDNTQGYVIQNDTTGLTLGYVAQH